MFAFTKHKRAVVEQERRRSNKDTYTTPLDTSGGGTEMKEFLMDFYRNILFKRREEMKQELELYPTTVGTYYRELVVSSSSSNNDSNQKFLSSEDFWQRYYYRCKNLDRIATELEKADAMKRQQRAQALQAALSSGLENAQKFVVNAATQSSSNSNSTIVAEGEERESVIFASNEGENEEDDEGNGGGQMYPDDLVPPKQELKAASAPDRSKLKEEETGTATPTPTTVTSMQTPPPLISPRTQEKLQLAAKMAPLNAAGTDSKTISSSTGANTARTKENVSSSAKSFAIDQSSSSESSLLQSKTSSTTTTENETNHAIETATTTATATATAESEISPKTSGGFFVGVESASQPTNTEASREPTTSNSTATMTTTKYTMLENSSTRQPGNANTKAWNPGGKENKDMNITSITTTSSITTISSSNASDSTKSTPTATVPTEANAMTVFSKTTKGTLPTRTSTEAPQKTVPQRPPNPALQKVHALLLLLLVGLVTGTLWRLHPTAATTFTTAAATIASTTMDVLCAPILPYRPLFTTASVQATSPGWWLHVPTKNIAFGIVCGNNNDNRQWTSLMWNDPTESSLTHKKKTADKKKLFQLTITTNKSSSSSKKEKNKFEQSSKKHPHTAIATITKKKLQSVWIFPQYLELVSSSLGPRRSSSSSGDGAKQQNPQILQAPWTISSVPNYSSNLKK